MNTANKVVGIGYGSVIALFTVGYCLLSAVLDYGAKHPFPGPSPKEIIIPQEKIDRANYRRWLADYKNPHTSQEVLERDLAEIKKRGSQEPKYLGSEGYYQKENAIQARLDRMRQGLPEPPSTSRSRANEDF